MALYNYLTVNVPDDLLPQVCAEILQFTRNPDLVEVVQVAVGREIHVDPHVADEWMIWRKAKEEADAKAAEPQPEPEPEPVAPEPEPEPEPAAPEPAPEPVAPVPTASASKKGTTAASPLKPNSEE